MTGLPSQVAGTFGGNAGGVRHGYGCGMGPELSRVVCRLCGAVIRSDDAIVVVGDEPLHCSCAEPALSTSDGWQHVSVTTLRQLARGAGSASG
jgi:hypothetical protein